VASPTDQIHAHGNLDGAELQWVLRSLWAGKIWIIATTLVFSLICISAAFLIHPVYRASVVMVSASSEQGGLAGALRSSVGSLGGLASLAGVNLGNGDQALEEALAVLRSRQLTQEFIVRNQAMPVLFSRDWDAQRGAWKVSSEDAPTVSDGAKLFERKVRRIEHDRKTGLITVSIDCGDRNLAADWANSLVDTANAEMRRRAIESSNAALDFLGKELGATATVETREAISRLIEAQVNRRMLANVSQQYSFRVVDRAVAPDQDDPVSPNRMLLIAAGPAIGLCIGVGLVLLLSAVRRSRALRGS
jgi:uncharacterized protein involved in exopolysaccharide biosynthesis